MNDSSHPCGSVDSIPVFWHNSFVQNLPLVMRRLTTLLCWLIAGSFALVASASISSSLPFHFVREWQVEKGLPQNKVTAVVQTHDGYLWIGTYSGLGRFDGVNFTVFDGKNTPALRSSRITSLFESSANILWIGHENGDVTVFKDGKFTPAKLLMHWTARKIYAITTDDADDVWLLNEDGLLGRVRDGLVLSPERGNAIKIMGLARSANGRVWVTREGYVSVLEHAQLHVLPFEESPTNIYVQGICASRDGGLWITNDGRLRKWKDGQWVSDLGAAPWALVPLTSFTEMRNGTLVATTSNTGLFLVFPDTNQLALHINRFNDLEANWIISAVEDNEGDLWLGTGGNGLIEMRSSNIQTIEPPDRWRGRALLAVYPGHDGEMWIGTEGAGLYRYQNGSWANFGYTNFIGNSYVWSIAEDNTSNLFVGTWGAGLFLRAGDNFKYAPGLDRVMLPMPALLPARAGGLWVGTSEGLLRYQNGKTNWFIEANGKKMRDVRTIAESADGTVWFGTAGSGLGRLENNRITQFTQADGLSSDFIECLHFDEAGALWIGTFGGGLCRLKAGKIFIFDRPQGLPNSVIGDIEDDDSGFFWMSSHGGIIRADKKELNDCADGKISTLHWLTYGVNDGLPTIECSEGLQPAGAKTPDGRLWFPTSKGLVVIDTREVKINYLPPPVILEQLLVDDHPVSNFAQRLKIAPGHNRLEFQYTALSFVAPEKVRFKYRIEGLEKKWVDAGTRRSVEYGFLPPGDFIFHVIACNNDGIWNETGASLPFTLLPHFWQTWWFRILIGTAGVAASGGIVWYDTRRRMRRKLERIERQREIEHERARIAHDIHDELGAQLTRITMLSESAREELDDQRQASDDLGQIYDTAREATRAMDEIVWAVNPKHDTLESLASYLEKFALDFLGAAGIRCRLDMPLQFPKWRLTSEARHNLFLTYKEALNNVAKHAAATEVRISLALESSAFVLDIEDNGRGFNPQNLIADPARLSGGIGLESMKNRLAGIGGRCEIISTPGNGTKVKFQVTLKSPRTS